MLTRIDVAFAAENYSEAMRLATAAVGRWPTDARFHAAASAIASAEQAFERAVTHAITASTLEPWLVKRWHVTATALLAVGRAPDARRILERLVALHPSDARAAVALAEVNPGGEVSTEITMLSDCMRSSPRLSVCLIVKNEAERLPRCLQSLNHAFDELIVVDTGSTDATKTIALSFGAQVLSFPWCDDFSAARNHALAAATGDWILSIDADEHLDSESLRSLRSAISQQHAGAMTVRLDELLDDGGHYFERMTRLFRRHPLVRFEGRIHEQITPSLARCGFTSADAEVTLTHDGYQSAVVEQKDKLRRNERLLRMEIENAPNDAYWYYQLGKNQMMDRSYSDAIASFDAAIARLSQGAPPAAYVLELYASMLRLLVTSRDFPRAMDIGAQALAAFPSSPDVSFFAGQALLALGERADAKSLFEITVRNAKLCRDPALPPLAEEVVRSLTRAPAPGAATLLQNDFTAVTRAKHGTFMFNKNDAFIGRSLELYGEWCEAELDLLLPLLKPGMWALDVGANIGTHTIAMAKAVGERGHVVAFEPQAFTHMMLCGNVALNALNNVTVLRAAVGDDTRPVEVPRLDPREQRNFGSVKVGSGGDFVEQMRIDDLALEQCHLIKIDVEGFEAAVLRGAADTIARTQPLLFIENNTLERSHELLSLIERFGYRAYWHIAPYYRENNFAQNSENVFIRYQPEANLVAVSKTVEVAGLLPVSGPHDDWQNAMRRLLARSPSSDAKNVKHV